MGLVAVASAKGSPGSTTTALVLGALWPRPVIVAECDPHGGDVALRMAAADGGVLDPERGLLSLAAAGRKALHAELVPTHTQRVVGGLDVLVGVRTPEQAAGLVHSWGQLGPILARLSGRDVIADLGRLGASTPQTVLLPAATDLLLVCDALPSNVVHLRDRIGALEPKLRPRSSTGTRIHVVVIADPKRVQAVREIREALERASAPVSAVHHLAADPKGAGFFAGRIDGRADRTLLVRSVRPLAARLAADTAVFHIEPPPAEEPSAATAATAAEWPGWQPPRTAAPTRTVAAPGAPRANSPASPDDTHGDPPATAPGAASLSARAERR